MAEHGTEGQTVDRHDDRDVVLSQHQLHILLDDAAESGATRALERIGLQNGNARRDIDDLRGLAGAVRTMRSTALSVATKAVTLAIIGGLLAWVGARTKLTSLLKPFSGN